MKELGALQDFIYFTGIVLDNNSKFTTGQKYKIFDAYFKDLDELPNGSVDYICSITDNTDEFLYILNKVITAFPDFINESCNIIKDSIIIPKSIYDEEIHKKVLKRGTNKDSNKGSLDKSLNDYIKKMLKDRKALKKKLKK